MEKKITNLSISGDTFLFICQLWRYLLGTGSGADWVCFWQTILVWGYFVHRQRKNQTGWFYAAVILAIIPLFLTKVTPFLNMEKHRYLVFRNLLFNL